MCSHVFNIAYGYVCLYNCLSKCIFLCVFVSLFDCFVEMPTYLLTKYQTTLVVYKYSR